MKLASDNGSTPTVIGHAAEDCLAHPRAREAEQAAGEEEQLSKRLRLKRKCVLALSSWVALCSGTAYGISAYQLLLIEKYGFTGADTGLCFTLAFLFNVIEPAGYLFAVFGSRVPISYGASFVAAGVLGTLFTLQNLSAERWAGNADVWLLASGFGAMAHGSAVVYTTALFSTIHVFQGAPRQGIAIGLVSSGFGLSAAVWVGIYSSVFTRNLHGFFVFFGCVYGVTILLLLCIVHVPPPDDREHEGRELVDAMDEFSFASPELDLSSKHAAERQQGVLRTILKNPDVLLYSASFALIQGTGGGVVLGNVSLLARALGASEKASQMVVSLFAIANCAARIMSGVLMDRWQSTTKPTFMLSTACVIASASLALAVLGDPLPLPLSGVFILAIGLAYGANWAIMPAYMATELEHNASVGFMFSAICVAPVSSIFAMMTDYFYDAQAESLEDDGNICVGMACFRAALVVTTCINLLAIAIARIVHLRIVRRADLEFRQSSAGEVAMADGI